MKIIKLMDDSDPSFWGNGRKKKVYHTHLLNTKKKKYNTILQLQLNFESDLPCICNAV